jgi:secreted PhoX family phosphatase
MLTRRSVFSSAFAAATVGWAGCKHAPPPNAFRNGLTQRTASTPELLRLPEGFHYVIVQTGGDLMSDGLEVPLQPDGMTCHLDPDGNYILLRNHEMSTAEWLVNADIDPEPIRAGRPDLGPDDVHGGVARVVLNPRILRRELRHDRRKISKAVMWSGMVLNKTEFNCSGGHTDRGWVTCEESSSDGHGYAYHVYADDTELVDHDERRLPSWGRFSREGIVLDKDTGIAYQTEDDKVGCLYRHVPDDPALPFGPGRLQALQIEGVKHTDRYATWGQECDPNPVPLVQGESFDITWVDIADAHATETTTREQGAQAGATRFTRGEGICLEPDGKIWFAATNAGPVHSGQLWKLDPQAQTLTLAYEVQDPSECSLPDNLLVAPWGDLIVAEDNYFATDIVKHQHLRARTPDGVMYDIARNEHNFEGTDDAPGAEFAGPCFSPDGRILFVNMQHPEGVTIAITGPWPHLQDS